MIAPEYDQRLSMQARLEARAERLGASGGAALDAELLLDARSVINDLQAACNGLLEEIGRHVGKRDVKKHYHLMVREEAARAAMRRAEGRS